MVTLNYNEFVKKAGGGTPTVVGNEASPQYKQQAVQSSPSYRSRVGEAFKAGLEQNQAGFDKVRNGGLVDKVTGALGAGAGVINASFSPLAPAFESTIGKGMEFVADKLADAYGEDVQRGLYEGGKTGAEKVLEPVVDATTIAGAVIGGPKAGEGLGKVKGGALKAVDKGFDVAETGVSKIKGMKQGLLEKNVDPRLKTSATRSETPLSKYEKFLEQEKMAKADVKADSALSSVGERIGENFEKVAQKRREVGARMAEELEKIGDQKVPVTESVQKFSDQMVKEGLSYDPETGAFVSKGQTKMTATDRGMLNDFVSEVEKLGTGEVSVRDLDAFVSRISKDLDLYKSKNNIIGTTNAERIIKNTLNEFRSNFDKFEDYAGARKEYADLSGFLEEGQSYLGKKTQAGDFAKDASIAKSSVQSLLNSGKKDWLGRLEELTGYSALDESVLALQAMKDMGNPKGASLLQLISEGDVPMSKSGLIDRIMSRAVDFAREKALGTPEEQTRAFLKSLETNPEVPKLLNSLRQGAKDVINAEKMGMSAKDVTKNIHPEDIGLMEKFIDSVRIDKRLTDADFNMAEKLAERFGISMDKGLSKVANDFEKILSGDKKVKGTAQTGRPFEGENVIDRDTAVNMIDDIVHQPTAEDFSNLKKIVDTFGESEAYKIFREGLLSDTIKPSEARGMFNSLLERLKDKGGIPKELESLAQEAKKYKSAEEFVRAQPTYYRGEGGSNVAQGKALLAEGKHLASDAEYPKGFGKVGEYVVKPNAKVLDLGGSTFAEVSQKLGIPERKYISPKELSDIAKQRGYDVLKYSGEYKSTGKSFTHIVDLTGNSTVAKSQLTDIWNKANKK